MSAPSRETLRTLRHAVAAIESSHAPAPALSLGVAALDGVLGGGLALGAVHEIAPQAPAHGGAATGFALALAALAADEARPVLWVQLDFAALEGGRLYGPGLDLLGLPLRRLILLRVAQARDGLWAMEEALKCPAIAVVVGEITDHAVDLTVTRRLSLAAGSGGGLGLILRPHATPSGSTAMTRWEVASAEGEQDGFGGLGRPTLALSLVRNRRGPAGRWLLSWDHHARAFLSASSRDLAAPALDGPDRARLRAG